MATLVPVILAGGKGERFWPLSRQTRPKQFAALDGSGQSLLQATADRLLPLAGSWASVWVITNAQLAAGVREQLPLLPEQNLLVEPEGRDTGPAVAWATETIARLYGQDAVVGIFPADHWIGDRAAFQATLISAATLAASQAAIATLGVAPTYPATGYGYIEWGGALGDFAGMEAYEVARFTEKPQRETAEYFLQTGGFSWNSGMFVFRAGVAWQALLAHAPEIAHPLAERGEAAYPELPKTSIDRALMEKTQQAAVLPAQFGWDDLGDWQALERLFGGEGANVTLAQHVGQDTQGTVLYASDSEEVIVTIGLNDLVVARDGRATLVARKDRIQELKAVLEQLQADPKLQRFL